MYIQYIEIKKNLAFQKYPIYLVIGSVLSYFCFRTSAVNAKLTRRVLMRRVDASGGAAGAEDDNRKL